MAQDWDALEVAIRHARGFRESLPDRPVGATASLAELRAAFDLPLGDDALPAAQVVDELARAAEGGLIANAGPRYFGFVIGGSSPASVGADWLTSAWDQNAGLYATAPALSVCEEVAAKWLLELFGLPATAGVGFVTGGQMANFTGLAAARHEVLRRAGWSVEDEGLVGAPAVRVIVGEQAHETILRALRLLGLGSRRALRVPTDDQGRIRPAELQRVLEAGAGPAIVCAQAGEVNTGAFDDLAEAARIAHAHGAWLHVDGAFGLWAGASPRLRHLVRGLEQADSWAVDAHKWLNVPYDCGLAIIADKSAHKAAMRAKAPYLVQGAGEAAPRDPVDWVPEFSRRARGFTVYAALRALGRRGVTDLIDRACAHATRFANHLRGQPGVELLNEVALNQVLVRFGDDDAKTRATIARAQREGTLWLGGTTWRGRAAARISVCGETTTEGDIDRSAASLLQAAAAEGARPSPPPGM